MSYIVNGKGPAGWRIDKLSDSEDESQALGLDFLTSYVAYVRERPVAEQIASLLNDAEQISSPAQPAPTDAINQCDGCRAGRPVDKNGNHRMGDGDYPNLQACQRHLYSQPAPTDDQKALRAAALEEAAELVLSHCWCDEDDLADRIRALAGSPAQQGQRDGAGEK